MSVMMFYVTCATHLSDNTIGVQEYGNISEKLSLGRHIQPLPGESSKRPH